jgi:hypothetical protein
MDYLKTRCRELALPMSGDKPEGPTAYLYILHKVNCPSGKFYTTRKGKRVKKSFTYDKQG